MIDLLNLNENILSIHDIWKLIQVKENLSYEMDKNLAKEQSSQKSSFNY